MYKKKAISPLIATVLLIGFTFTMAAILAGWGQNIVSTNVGEFTEESQKLSACRGGNLNFIPGYPKFENNRIKAVVEAKGVPLGDFVFEIVTTEGVVSVPDSLNTTIAPGRLGTVISEEINVDRSNITQLRIVTNCTDVKTIFKTL